MIKLQQGRVVEVRSEFTGDRLVSPHTAGATTLTVSSVDDFNEGGGVLQVGDTQYTYSDPVEDESTETATLTITPGLAADADEDSPVILIPYGEMYMALVELAETNEAVSVEIPHYLQDKFVDEIKAYDDQETVYVFEEDNEWHMFDVTGKKPSINGVLIDTTDMPDVGTDGLPPAVSPQPTAVGGLGAVFVKWTGITNHDPVTYELHMSTNSGATITPGDAATMVAKTMATSTTVRTDTNGDPLSYGQDYYFWTVATDEDGAGPVSLPSAAAQMMQVNSEDVAVNAIWAGQAYINNLIGDELSANVLLSGSIYTSTEGQGVRINSEGITGYDSTGSTRFSVPTDPEFPVVVSGQATLDTAVIGDALLNSVSLAEGGKVVLLTGQGPPKNAPIVSNTYESKTWTAPVAFSEYAGFHYVSSTEAWSVRPYFDGTYWRIGLQRFDPSTGTAGSTWTGYFPAFGTGFKPVMHGVTIVGGYFYVVSSSPNATGTTTYITKIDYTTKVYVDHWTCQSSDTRIGVGNDGTNVLLVWHDAAAKRFKYRHWLVATNTMDAVVTIDFVNNLHVDVGSVIYGAFDFAAGGSRMVFAPRVNRFTSNLVTNGSTSVGTLRWETPSDEPVLGTWWDGANFRCLNASGVERKYESHSTTWGWDTAVDPYSTQYYAYTWADSVNSYETTRSPLALLNYRRRARVKMTIDPIPKLATNKPNGARAYMRRGSSTTSLTDVYRIPLGDGANYCPNPSFENNIDGPFPTEMWSYWDPAFPILSQGTIAHVGTKSLKTQWVQASQGEESGWIMQIPGVVNGNTYTITAWVWNETGGPTVTCGEAYSTRPTVAANSTWTKITHTVTATSGSLWFSLSSGTAVTAGQADKVTYVDEVMINEGSVALPYTEAWAGNPPSAVFTQLNNGTTNPAPATTAFGSGSNPSRIYSTGTLTDGVTPIFDAKGDGSGRWGDLTFSNTGKVSRVVPMMRRLRSTALSVAADPSNTAIDYTTAVESAGATGEEISYSAGTWTINKAGTYIVSASIAWAWNSAGRRSVWIQKNGTTVAQNTQPAFGSSTLNQTTAVVTSLRLAVNDTITIRGWQNTSGALNTAADAEHMFASVAWIGD